MDLIDWIIGGALAALSLLMAVLMAVLMLVYAPVMLKTEADCLRQGFPKYSVSIGLERYCLNMQGAVTTVVVPQK